MFCASVWFWLATLAHARHAQWKAIGALLLSGKVFCLVSALMVFATRPLFSGPDASPHAHRELIALTDQQAAGLMMLTACPLIYIAAAVVIMARWVFAATQQGRTDSRGA